MFNDVTATVVGICQACYEVHDTDEKFPLLLHAETVE